MERDGPSLPDERASNPVISREGLLDFAFSYAESARAACEKHCRNYDDFGGCERLDNEAPTISPEHRSRILRRLK